MAISKLKIYFYVCSSKKSVSNDFEKSFTITNVFIEEFIYLSSAATPSNFSLFRAIKHILNPTLHKSIQNYLPIPSEAPVLLFNIVIFINFQKILP